MESILLYRNTQSVSQGLGFGMGVGGRSSSASSAERSLLLGALATHMGVLDARENDAQTIIRKSELWDEITRQFNAQATTPRSRQQIQTLYKNMKAKARRYEARLAEVSTGVPPPEPDPISEMLLGLLHQQLQHQRRHLQNHLASLDPHTHAHTLDAITHTLNKEDSMKGSAFRSFDASDLLTPEHVMQMSMEEGDATENSVKGLSDVKDEPRDDNDDDDDDDDNIFSGLSDSRHNFPPSPKQIDTESNTDEQKKAEVDNPSQQQQQQQKQHLNSPAISKLLYQQQVSALANLPHMGAHTGPQVNPSPLLPQPSSPQTLDFHPPKKRSKLDMSALSEMSRFGANLRLPAKFYSSSSATSSCCSCPELHASILSFSRQEHNLRKKLMQEEKEMRIEEHAARMRIFALKEKFWRAKSNCLKADTEGFGENNDDFGCGDDVMCVGDDGVRDERYGDDYGDDRDTLKSDDNCGKDRLLDEVRVEDDVTTNGDANLNDDIDARNADNINGFDDNVVGCNENGCEFGDTSSLM